MDFSKLSLGDKIIGGCTVVFFIATFLPWFSVDCGLVSADGNGWDVGFIWSGFPFLLALVMCAQIGISRFAPDTQLPELPWGKVHLGLGAFAALLVLLKLLIGEDDAGGFCDVSRSFGIFLALLAAIGLAAGGFFKMQEEASEAGAGGGGATPPQAF